MGDRPEAPARRYLRARLASAAFVATVGGLAVWFQGPPGVSRASSPPEVFSAERAMRHVEAIAREPHPLGSRGPKRSALTLSLN